jgi:DNA-3-methyladenine glycosylase
MYECLNFSCEPEGSPGCVLIRALEPLAGIDEMRERRGHPKRDRDLANGPGKLTLAMGITRAHNGLDVTSSELLVCEPATRQRFEITTSTRIGIQHNTDWEMRFFIAGNVCVSKA